MNGNVLKYEDITENIIALNVKNSYNENMTDDELYDITRGFWRVNYEMAQLIDYAFCVYKGEIKQVYKIKKWLPAGSIPRPTLPDVEVPKKRYEFVGEIAEKEIQDKYIGKYIKGQQNPINYLPSKDEIKNRKKAAINKEIGEIQKIEKVIASLDIDGASKKVIVNVRVNQGIFRDLLLNKYKECCLCGVEDHNLLIASHIKPWAESKPKEKTDINNGFLLCPNHDKLFDKGYITFDDDGKIIISHRLTENDKKLFNINSGMYIELTDDNKKYLKFHRENIFKKENFSS